MAVANTLLSTFSNLTLGQLNGLVALAAVALAGFTVFVVFSLARALVRKESRR